MSERAPAYLSAPAGLPRSRQRPSLVLRALAAQLRERDLTRLYLATCPRFGVLSVAYQLTVWTNGRVLWWHVGVAEITWPAADVPGAALRLARLAAELTAAPPGEAPPPE